MYVCLCNAIRDSEIREAVRRGVRTADEAYRSFGVRMHCVACGDYVQGVIDDILAREARA